MKKIITIVTMMVMVIVTMATTGCGFYKTTIKNGDGTTYEGTGLVAPDPVSAARAQAIVTLAEAQAASSATAPTIKYDENGEVWSIIITNFGDDDIMVGVGNDEGLKLAHAEGGYVAFKVHSRRVHTSGYRVGSTLSCLEITTWIKPGDKFAGPDGKIYNAKVNIDRNKR